MYKVNRNILVKYDIKKETRRANFKTGGYDMKSKKMISLTLAGMMALPMVAYGSEDPLANLPETLGPENPVAATPEMYSNIDLSKKVNVNMIMVGDKPNDWEDVNEAINEYLEPFNTTLSASNFLKSINSLTTDSR